MSRPRSSASAARANDDAGSFETFVEGWQVREQHYLDELLTALESLSELQDEYLKDLITRVLAHHEQFYEEKSRIIRQDVISLFETKWLTPLELTFLWITGFRPGLVCSMAAKVDDLSAQQKESINKLMHETKVEERDLNNEYAKVQESLAMPPLFEQAKEAGRRFVRRGRATGPAPLLLKEKLEQIVMSADALRTNTVLKLVKMLNPAQSVKFLAAACEFQHRIRTFGQQQHPVEVHGNGGTSGL